jgi:hypothetical protein
LERVRDRVVRALVFLLASAAYASAQSHSYPIFRNEDLFTENEQVTCDETWEGDQLYLLCRDNRNDEEIFRTRIGDRNGKFSNYGIAEQRDFNGDGKLDFAIYESDDQSQHYLLALSFGQGYRVFDLGKSVTAYALHHLHRAVRLEDPEVQLKDARLVRNGKQISFAGTIVGQGPRTQFVVPASEFLGAR